LRLAGRRFAAIAVEMYDRKPLEMAREIGTEARAPSLHPLVSSFCGLGVPNNAADQYMVLAFR
jgi:hypothetical protein